MSRTRFNLMSPIAILIIGDALNIDPHNHLVFPNDATSFSYLSYMEEVWSKINSLPEDKIFDSFEKLCYNIFRKYEKGERIL